jgi:multidrug transporter EmrE-like cation transporter
MRPLGVVGIILIVAGVIVLALRGISYTKDRDTAKLGPVEISAEKKGFVPPIAGIVAVGVGLVFVALARRQV